MYKAIDFLGIKVSAITKKEIVDKILEFTLTGKRKIIMYLDAHCVNVAFMDPEYRKILKGADLVCAGGKALVWASKLFDSTLPERVNSLDFFDSLVEGLIEKKIKVYLLGCKPSVVQKAVDELKRRFSDLTIVGYHHGFFNQDQEINIIKEINALRPNILMVGMGVPRQEKWIYKHLNDMDVNLFWAVGGAFNNISGIFKRAPAWMINCGLEWLYRLFQEPERLWKRYIIGNFIFIYHVLSYKIRQMWLKQ